jgi:hypothetical protein
MKETPEGLNEMMIAFALALGHSATLQQTGANEQCTGTGAA